MDRRDAGKFSPAALSGCTRQGAPEGGGWRDLLALAQRRHMINDDHARSLWKIVIITGQRGAPSGGQGLNVNRSLPQDVIDLATAGSKLTQRMSPHPGPIIVALPGHAMAKGAFILPSTDYRIGVDGPFTTGLNEVQIGITMQSADEHRDGRRSTVAQGRPEGAPEDHTASSQAVPRSTRRGDCAGQDA